MKKRDFRRIIYDKAYFEKFLFMCILITIHTMSKRKEEKNRKEEKDLSKQVENEPNEQCPENVETLTDETAAQEDSAPEKKELEELQAKYDKLNDTYLRTLAEYDNYRKRSIREKSDLLKSGGETVLINILSVVDDFERGMASMENAQDIQSVKEGTTLIYNKLQSFLKQNGVTVIETEHKEFDTDLHEAITTIPAPDESLKGKIIDCVQKGYFLHDKVIRFAKVVVGN